MARVWRQSLDHLIRVHHASPGFRDPERSALGQSPDLTEISEYRGRIRQTPICRLFRFLGYIFNHFDTHMADLGTVALL